MSTAVRIPPEYREHTDQLDHLMDICHDIGGTRVEWGIRPSRRHVIANDRVYIRVTGLPGHTTPLEEYGPTLNHCAFVIMHREWPDPSDQAEDAA